MRKLIAIIILAATAGMIYYYLQVSEKQLPDAGPSGSGTIEAIEVSLGSPLAGRIKTITVKRGDSIGAGDLLAVIEHGDLIEQRKALDAAIDAAAALIRQGELKLANARKNFGRLKTLADSGGVARKQFEDADSELQQAQAGLSAGENQRMSLVHQQRALIEKIAYAEVTAPVDGVIIARNFEPGEIASPGATLLKAASLREVWLNIYIPETELGQVRIGQAAELSIDSFPGRVFPGKVVWISSTAEFTPKTIMTPDERVKLVYAVKISAANPDGVFKIGMPADARIIGD